MTGIFSVIFVSFMGAVSGQMIMKTALESYDYCDPKLKLCDVATDHVMCKYPISGPSDKCTPTIHEPLSRTEKNRILFWHNKFRSNIATKNERNINKKLPMSSNMRQIYWDQELEMMAERWAQQCVSSTTTKVYDICRNVRRFKVSQNVGTHLVNNTTIEKQAPQIVITWFKENKDFLPDYIDKFPVVEEDRTPVKEFANMIWADSYAIGCARVIFRENLSSIDFPKKISAVSVERLICNYGPSGNKVGKPVYKRGTPCTNCPTGTMCSRIFPGLCAIQNAETIQSPQNVGEGGKEQSKDPSERTTSEVSAAKATAKPKILKEGEDQDQIFRSGGAKDDEKEKGVKVHPIGPSDLNRINEILKNPKNSTVHELTNGVDYENKKRADNEKKRKIKRDIANQKPTQNGERCACHIPKNGENSSVPRTSIGLLFFCAGTILRLLLL